MAHIIRYSPHLGTNIGLIVWPIDPNHEIASLLWYYKTLPALSGLGPWSTVNLEMFQV